MCALFGHDVLLEKSIVGGRRLKRLDIEESGGIQSMAIGISCYSVEERQVGQLYILGVFPIVMRRAYGRCCVWNTLVRVVEIFHELSVGGFLDNVWSKCNTNATRGGCPSGRVAAGRDPTTNS